MPKTAVGLFKSSAVAEEAVRDIESSGLPRNEVRTLDEPLDFGQTGVTSIPRIDFEVAVSRELTRMGATKPEAEAYVEGLRRGGVLIFATATDDKKVDVAADIMNRHGAVEIEEIRGPEPDFPDARGESTPAARDTPILTGRRRQAVGGACFFVW